MTKVKYEEDDCAVTFIFLNFSLYCGNPPISQIFKKVRIVKNSTQPLILPALFHPYLFSQFCLFYRLLKDLIINLQVYIYWKLFDNFSFTGKTFSEFFFDKIKKKSLVTRNIILFILKGYLNNLLNPKKNIF